MLPNQDPIDQAFGLLKARSRGRAPTNLDLEERMMRESMKAPSVKKSIFVKTALAVLVCVVVGGGVVAAGGVQQISEFFGLVSTTVEVFTLDGDSFTVEGVLDGNRILDENGDVILTFDNAVDNPSLNEGQVVNEDSEAIEGGTLEIAE